MNWFFRVTKVLGLMYHALRPALEASVKDTNTKFDDAGLTFLDEFFGEGQAKGEDKPKEG